MASRLGNEAIDFVLAICMATAALIPISTGLAAENPVALNTDAREFTIRRTAWSRSRVGRAALREVISGLARKNTNAVVATIIIISADTRTCRITHTALTCDEVGPRAAIASRDDGLAEGRLAADIIAA